jgi:CubicO group peptidase (beta-lactamase class C family)
MLLKNRVKWILVILGVVVSTSLLNGEVRGKLERRARYYLRISEAMWLRTHAPNVVWDEASPEQVGLSSEALDEMLAGLERRGTSSFIIVRRGRLVYEWYSAITHANTQLGLAAAAKPIIGAWLLLLSVDDSYVDLDDYAKKYIVEWADDPVRSKITLRQLASHVSGMDDVAFNSGNGDAEEWKRRYEEDRGVRFEMAIHEIPMLSEPGEREAYSGVAYYALSYALMKARSEADDLSHGNYLAKHLMEPLGIPGDAWRLSYGESYVVDDMVLQAIGSGASVTARAAARIASLMLTRGEWEGQQLIEARWFMELVQNSASLPNVATLGHGRPSLAMGWTLNRNGFFPSLPRDAILAMGRKQQIVLVIPSLELIAVRTGGYLGGNGANVYQDLESYFNVPLMRSLTEPN